MIAIRGVWGVSLLEVKSEVLSDSLSGWFVGFLIGIWARVQPVVGV